MTHKFSSSYISDMCNIVITCKYLVCSQNFGKMDHTLLQQLEENQNF